jgi:hypothetical protein
LMEMYSEKKYLYTVEVHLRYVFLFLGMSLKSMTLQIGRTCVFALLKK